jgi:class 3 adenylate cyclase/tetratricopeptide (TPR) repeat protein
VICSSCGASNETGQKFCGECGSRLLAGCPSCGAANPPGRKFCGECGAALAAAAAPPAASAAPSAPRPVAQASSERRLVSVLFADLVGFTALAADRDPEETRDLLGRYFDLAREVVGRYGGTIEKFIGDAVMALWGAPSAQEDDAERAVRAGLELVDAVRVLGPAIQARAGVLTGEAVVTVGAVGQGMVAGDLVNTASRLQSVAPPGAVLVGEATYRAASRAIAFESVGEHALKGKPVPVPAWRALRVVAEVGGRNRRATLEAPFVGRDDELRLIKDLFHATAREKRARLVSVVGPAGIGKTRLAWEFLKYVDGLLDTIWWHDGRSPAYGEGITFWALGEMVRERCELLETDDEPTTRAKVAEALARHVPDLDERRWIEPALLSLLGLGGRIDSDQLFGAWRTFFERLAATAPVVMVFEDFHFADAGLLDFVDHLLEWSRSVPIYVVTLARPELLERRADWGAGKRNFTSLYLEPLSEGAMRELLAGLVPGLPEVAVRAIVARADGVPLYAVETVRMLVADGRLEERDGAYAPVGDLSRLAVPETLTALIASRLDTLPSEERALVADAAVLGQSFTPAALAAVSGEDVAALEPRLRSLVRRELFAVEADPRSPERGQYAFLQALIREVAYNTLAHADRRTRHLAAARFFESLGSDELAGALAGHYLAAHANATAGPEADALAGQARVALRGAAERAGALGAHDQALMFLEQALTVTHEPADRATLLERAGEAAISAGRLEAADRLLQEALDVYRALGDRVGTARATGGLARALLSGYRTAEALALLEPAAREFGDLADEPAVVSLGGGLARAYFLAGDSRRAIEVGDRVLEAAEHADLGPVIADVLATKGTSLGHLGRPVEGLAILTGAQALAESLGMSATLVRVLINRSNVEATRNPGAALATSRTGLALARRLGLGHNAAILLSNGAEYAIRTGEWAWALAELEAALAGDVEPVDRMMFLQVIVMLRACRGESWTDLLDELRGLVGESDDPTLVSTLEIAVGTAAFAMGRLGDARIAWHRVADVSTNNRPDALARAARAALWAGERDAADADLAALDASGVHGQGTEADRSAIRAGILALEGRAPEAVALYRDALQAWRDLGLAWDEALAGLDMALLLDPTDPEVRSPAESARAILVRLGARPFVERLDAALERSHEAGSTAVSHAGPAAVSIRESVVRRTG